MQTHQLVSFLRDMLADDLEVAAYRADPSGYLARHGLEAVDKAQLDAALPQAVAGLEGDRLRLVRPYIDDAGPAATLAEAVAGMLPEDDSRDLTAIDLVIESAES